MREPESLSRNSPKRRRCEYTLEQFSALKLPSASKTISEVLGDSYEGPFMKHYNQVAATYELRFQGLEPALRKLDLMLAGKDEALVRTAGRVKKQTLSLKKASSLDPRSLQGRPRRPVFELSNAAGWETVPHTPERLSANSATEDRAAPGGSGAQVRAFTECHETANRVIDVWIPELVPVFDKLNALLAAAEAPTGVSATKSGFIAQS